MGCLASKASAVSPYKHTRASLGLESEQWVEVNARKVLLPRLLARIKPLFQKMVDQGKSFKEIFLKFDEDDGRCLQ